MRVIHYMGDKLGSGGIESFLSNIAQGLANYDIENIICVNYYTNNIYEEKFLKYGTRVEYLAEIKLNRFFKLIRFVKFAYLNKEGIFHIHASSTNMYVHCFIAKLLGINKIVYHIHSTISPEYSILKCLKNKILDKIFSSVPKVKFACSISAGNRWYGNNKFSVITNGIDVERFAFNDDTRRKMRKILCLDNFFVIGQVGRFAFAKNQKFSINLMKYLPSKFKLVLIGEGDEYNELQDMIIRYNLNNRVMFIKPQVNIEDYYQAFDAFIFPSIYEGLGIVALEAQCAGLPVLCSENIPIEVFFTDNIYRINLNNIDTWKKKLIEISCRDIDRIGGSKKGIKQCIEARFSIEDMIGDLVSIYRTL